jgi:hypothetical protein
MTDAAKAELYKWHVSSATHPPFIRNRRAYEARYEVMRGEEVIGLFFTRKDADLACATFARAAADEAVEPIS